MSFLFPVSTSAHGIHRRCPWAVSEAALAALFHQHFLKCLCQFVSPPPLSPPLSPTAVSSKKRWELSLRAFQASSVFTCQQRVFTGLKYIVGLWLSANPQPKRWSVCLFSTKVPICQLCQAAEEYEVLTAISLLNAWSLIQMDSGALTARSGVCPHTFCLWQG